MPTWLQFLILKLVLPSGYTYHAHSAGDILIPTYECHSQFTVATNSSARSLTDRIPSSPQMTSATAESFKIPSNSCDIAKVESRSDATSRM